MLNVPQQMMSLSAVAYADENHGLDQLREWIAAGVAGLSCMGGGGWRIVWGPALLDQTLMFCAQEVGGDGSPLPRFAITIRGTDFLAISNWLQDFWVALTDFSTPAISADGAQPKVSKGTALGLENLVDMYEGVTPHLFHLIETRNPTRSLHEYFIWQGSRWRELEIVVTGHSMGGCLASAFAVWLADHLMIARCPVRISTCTFAAPTAGDATFAEYADARLAGRASRYYNVHDIVPLAWNEIAKMRTTPVTMTDVDAWAVPIIDSLQRDVTSRGFTQYGTAYPLSANGNLPSGDWLDLIGLEHAATTYLSLLGAPAPPV